MSDSLDFETVQKQYFEFLAQRANIHDKVCRFVDCIDEDETPNPTLSDLKALRYIFISRNANSNIKRLDEACSMVGRDHWTDIIGMTNTASSYEFHLIFQVDLNLAEELFNTKKYALCTDVLIGLLLTFKSWDHGFVDTDCPQDAQQILDRFSNLWNQIITINDKDSIIYKANQNLNILTAGYLRAIICNKNHIYHGIPKYIIDRIELYNRYYINLDRKSKNVLLELIQEVRDNLSEFNYDLDCEDYTDQSMMDVDHTDDLSETNKNELKRTFDETDIVDHDFTESDVKRRKLMDDVEHIQQEQYWRNYEQLSKKTVVELKKICKKRRIYCVKGRKRELIWRILNPDKYILWMKRKYHYEVISKQKSIFFNDTPQEEVNECYTLWGEFDPNKYNIENGKVKERKEWYFERKGEVMEEVMNEWKMKMFLDEK